MTIFVMFMKTVQYLILFLDVLRTCMTLKILVIPFSILQECVSLTLSPIGGLYTNTANYAIFLPWNYVLFYWTTGLDSEYEHVFYIESMSTIKIMRFEKNRAQNIDI